MALALLVAAVRFFPVEVNRPAGDDLIVLGRLTTGGPPREVVLATILLAVAATMALIGEGEARTFVRFPPLGAYRLDILGSIAGIVAFSTLAFVGSPPVVWALVAGVGFLVLYRPEPTMSAGLIQVGAVALTIVVLAVASLAAGASWSPYYKVTVETEPSSPVSVKGIPHQALSPTNDDPPGSHVVPYDRAAHVDAVEIDRRLHQFSTQLHPTAPTPIRGSTSTSTTGGRSWTGPTARTTSSCSPCPTC
ncbi:MAG: hypothetical protein ACRD0A_20710 [Acidimicrobiales bacterium]